MHRADWHLLELYMVASIRVLTASIPNLTWYMHDLDNPGRSTEPRMEPIQTF